MHAQEILSTHPDVRGSTNDILLRCLDACYDCAQSCTVCADACLAEDMVKELRQCIRLNMDCADICTATGALASRRTGSNETILKMALELCARACAICGEECTRHAKRHEHCRICADTCRQCEEACMQAMQTITL